MTKATSPQIDNFLGRLSRVKASGDGWTASCPCRSDDDNPSLSISQGTDGRVLATCHRGGGCSINEICEAVGISMNDLFPRVAKPEREKLILVATYDYIDEAGTLLFQKQRFTDENGRKTFRQRKPDGRGGWDYKLGDTPKVLYNLPAVLEAANKGQRVYVVEGEKDADVLIELGYVATTMPGGAGKWLDIHTNALVGAKVEVIADNDEPGRQHAHKVLLALSSAGIAARAWRTPKGKDVAEFVALDGNLKDVVPLEDLDEMIEVVVDDVEPDPISKLAEDLADVLGDRELSDNQKLNRASVLLLGFGAPSVVPNGRLVDWQEFVTQEYDDSYDWVIPGLIERQERVIVVASEGVGKTMLARQVAICSAAGLHPFKMNHMKPLKTLTIDLENPERIIRRTSRAIMINALKYGHTEKVNAHILIQPSGIDLLKASDRKFIEQAIETVSPDLICIGPLYKSFVDPGGRTSEALAVEVAKYLDTIRDVYNCALWMEHHAPLGSQGTRDLRPFGSAVWSRWPEFGLSLMPDPLSPEGFVYQVRHFRGERDVREFPTKMKRGKIFPFEVLEFRKVE
mgnify:CR=1 FL=1